MQVARIIITLFLFQMAILVWKDHDNGESKRRLGLTCEGRSITKKRKGVGRQRSRRMENTVQSAISSTTRTNWMLIYKVDDNPGLENRNCISLASDDTR
jgi:hypothetical protein